MRIQIKRIYDPPDAADGFRVLVDRLWPRGVKKADAGVDYWAKDLAPTTELRKWFHGEDAEFSEFRRRYLQELETRPDAVRALLEKATGDTITLLFAARDPVCNHAVVLRDFLIQR